MTITIRDKGKGMDGIKSGVKTSSFKVLAGVLAGGGGLSAISPEHMTHVSDFLSSLPVGAYGALVAYFLYRGWVETTDMKTARLNPTEVK